MKMLRRLCHRFGIGGTPGSVSDWDSVIWFGPFSKLVIRTSEGEPYLTRYLLSKTRWGRIFIHAIHRSDQDRELHDHPWKFVSLLLWGPGYREFQSDGSIKRFGPFSINWRLDAASPHRLELDETRGPQWTLVVCGRHLRTWGFHVPLAKARRARVTGGRSDYVEDTYWIDHETFHELAAFYSSSERSNSI